MNRLALAAAIATSAAMAFWLPANLAAGTEAAQPYLPLASAVVNIAGDRSRAVVQQILDLAHTKHFRAERGDLPKQGRSVVNITIYVTSDSFFHADNFVDPDQLTLNAYSHDTNDAWIGTWQRMLSDIKTKVGDDGVNVLKEP
jgi:hypothetical protein